MSNAEAPIRLNEVWAFCHARLDESVAALLEFRDSHKGSCINNAGQDPTEHDEHGSCIRHLAAADATPYRDAEFGLADVAFKRLMLEEHEPGLVAAVQGDEVTPMVVCGIDGDDCEFTRRLAGLFARHPDYRESWRP